MTALTRSTTDRKTIQDHILRHPMAAFVILAYALSSFWLLNYRIDLGTVNGFGIIGSLSPALAAMTVSALMLPEPSGIPAGRRWRLFALTGISALAVMTGLRLWAAGPATVAGMTAGPAPYPTALALAMDVLAAAAVAYVLSGVCSGRQGVHDLLRSLDPRSPRVARGWWAAAVGLYPAVLALGSALSVVLGVAEPASKGIGPWYWLAAGAVITLLYCLFGGGGLEEPGWRGFALPLLQKRYTPLRASLILGVIWTFWHWPHMWLALPEAGPLVVVSFLLQVIPLAILFTFVYNHTAGSLAVAVLLHASINVADMFLPSSALASGLLLLLGLGIALWMWKSARK